MVLPKTILGPSPLDPLLLLPIPSPLPSSPQPDLDPLLQAIQSHIDSPSPLVPDNDLAGGEIPITVLTSAIRQITRKSQILLNNARNGVAESRNQLDNVDEDLRGVEYELTRVRDEIRKCSEYAPAYEEMDLPSTEEYLGQADEVALGALPPKYSEDHEHELTIARLEYELKEIEKREILLSQISKERDNLIKAKKEIKMKFDAVDVHLGGFSRSANAVASKLKDVADLPTTQIPIESTPAPVPAPAFAPAVAPSAE
ncbi:uncharacterized protein I303_107108 [Kwoniella dejecticola CBS 10117]|uniref:THO complex subunit 5 n=1 Tax=Kwoniella dejecticola CBS 10117 TaxID=1296121 RepID=A0A1A5ZYS0_9TREE|nr:uncharacterized protein I303_06510 [Kwoniella dejecticola CBS 10117]OBR82952.1 hypothetical protein I303_06510 [Kwoniella dejecticola CBS 10117]